ncbi:related to MTF1 - mitochondrial RNA polymerase specificity factor [Melanopsichium pennsylvanicum]|uniref:rRNA adenine N(6)-methyltransferase n=2 Tax=Melanopsichium pennsylvanicum TaxID=63383 RepID=A0AAJ4XN82_9BASI|nr:putative protein [Melanopsichium pennsylvanicum 4]SNX84896.1 related to MTF1 - mitochondrial RNA polymerase specificity factor [Melanopsichium pennsylvanicum]
MTSIGRQISFPIAQLAESLGCIAIGNARRAALSCSPVSWSSRLFHTSAHVADSSSSSSTATGASASFKVEKPKRARRTKDQLEAARIAKQAFGIPMRSRRRTRTSVGSLTHVAKDVEAANSGADVDANSNANADTSSEQVKPKRGIGRPKTKDKTPSQKQLDAQARREARAVAEEEARAEEVKDRESMVQLFSQMQYDHLDSRDEWKAAFPNSKQHQTSYRYFVSNRNTIQEIIPHLGIQDPERKGEKVTIIEGYPGPGTFTSELVKMDEVEKVIALESTPCYLEKLQVLQSQLEASKPGEGQRLDMLKESAYLWDTYNQLVESGRLAHLNNRVATLDGGMVDFTTNDFIPAEHSDASWQKLSPLMFFAQLPNTVYGEQLFAQIITAIAGRIWLFRHGRIQLGFICGESLAKRCLGEAGDKLSRGKLGTTVQCLADVGVHRYAHEFSPHSHHFFPPTMSVGPRVTLGGQSLIPNSNPSTGLTRTGMVMMTVTPKKNPLIKPNEIEAFEFITRNLFILRTKRIGEALTHVAPGGQNVLRMTGPQQVEKGLIRKEEVILADEIVCNLSNVQWACLARMFDKWPFRPKHLFEEGRVKPDNKNRH